MDKIERAFDKVLGAVSVILAGLLAVIVVIICTQTFFRYVVFRSLVWSEELTRYLFVIMMSYGLCVGITRDSLIRVDIIDRKLSERGRRAIRVCYAFVGAVVCLLLSRFSLELIQIGMLRRSSAMQIPMGYIYAVVMGGYILASVAALLRLARSILELARPKQREGGEA